MNKFETIPRRMVDNFFNCYSFRNFAFVLYIFLISYSFRLDKDFFN